MAITTNNLISRQTVGSAGAATVTFSNIPQTFTDLRIVVSVRSSSGSFQSIRMTVNSATTNYSNKRLYGDGASAASDGGTPAYLIQTAVSSASETASTFGNAEFYIPNYASANYKSVSLDSVAETNASTAYAFLGAGLWSQTTAISSIDFVMGSGNFEQYSTFSLYGISSNTTTQNTSVPSATGGDVITTDGTYWYHQFLYSGTFTPLKALTADYLVVAGGGAGGKGAGLAGGGGGGGGFRTGSGLSVTAQNYTVTVGAGAPTPNQDTASARGSDSVFDTITSTGGGGGGYGGGAGAPITGGSGGGGSSKQTVGAAGNTPSTSPSQGNNGGRGYTDNATFDNGGGGGGAGAVGQGGQNSSGGYAGAGGAGSASSISGSSVTYAGGGGAASYNGTQGSGGAGGGGNGSRTANGSGNGTVNLGGGGGGGGSGTGGAGGSGIVIVRYAV